MRVFAICLVLLVFLASSVWAGSLSLEAGSAVLFDMRAKRLLYEQDSTRRIPPASLTKVMAMYVVLDAVKRGKLSLRTPVRISKAAARVGGSTMHLKAGERVRLDDLLRGMAVASANDAAVAVAEHMAGSQTAFVDMMNRKSAQIGLKNTVFKTPHGLPAKGQITTAADMLRLACRYLEDHPSARWYHSSLAMFHNGMVLPNTNKMLGHDAVNGLKTGFTRASGYNIILTSSLHGKEMVGVLMRAPSGEVRTREAQRLLEYGANMPAPQEKKPAKVSVRQKAKLANAGKTSMVPELPRRILPQTASLPPSVSGRQ